MIVIAPGETVILSLAIRDEDTPANEPVTGQTATVSIRRRSDDAWWDFVAGAWDVATWATLGAEHKGALTDQGDGSYERSWNQATADASATREYEMVYQVAAGGYQGMAYETWKFDLMGVATEAKQDTIIATGGPGPWTSGGAGSGANTVVVTITDALAVPVLGLGVTIWNSDESAVIAGQVTDALGQVTFYLDDGTYVANTPDTPAWSGSSNALVVSGATTDTFAVTANAITPPLDPTLCRVYAYMREIEGGTVLGADEGTLNVVALRSRPSGATIIYGDGVAARGTDANGFVYVDIVRGATVQLRGTWTGTTARTEDVEVVVPDSATYNVGVLFEV